MPRELASTKMANHIHGAYNKYPIFGENLAYLSWKSVRKGEKELPDRAHYTARVMAKYVHNLLASEHPDDQKATTYINDHFNTVEMPFIKEKIATHVSTLPENDILAWISQASERDIAVFSIYHLVHHNELHNNVQRHLPTLRGNVLDGIDYVIESGVFPKQAKRQYESVLNSFKFVPLDSFLAGSGNLAGFNTGNIIGYVTPYSDANFSNINIADLSSVYIHEATHGIGGRLGRGFFSGIQGKAIVPNRATEEFFVTHVEVVATTKSQPAVLDPDKRADGLRRYYEERKLHAITSEHMPADLWGHAFAHSKYSPRGIFLRRELARGIAKGFGSWQDYLDFSDSYYMLDNHPAQKELTRIEIESMTNTVPAR